MEIQKLNKETRSTYTSKCGKTHYTIEKRDKHDRICFGVCPKCESCMKGDAKSHIDNCETTGAIYIIKLRSDRDTLINKVGMTKQRAGKRFGGYEKDSKLLFYDDVYDVENVEKIVMKRCEEVFKHRPDRGKEFFEGDTELMKDIVREICRDVNAKSKLLNKIIDTVATGSIDKSIEELEDEISMMELDDVSSNNKVEIDKISEMVSVQTKQNKVDKEDVSLFDLHFFISTKLTTSSSDIIKCTELLKLFNCEAIIQFNIKTLIKKLKDGGYICTQHRGTYHLYGYKVKDVDSKQ